MFERFTRESRGIVEQAEKEARALGAPAMEAEHLLLALARRNEVPIDPEELAGALATEFEASLGAVGVDLDAYGPPLPAPRRGRLRLGASAKLSLQRTVELAVKRKDQRFGAEHIALGILGADRGTVPRALEVLAIDRAALADELIADLA